MASTDRFNRIATNNSRYSYATAYNPNTKSLSGKAPRGAQVPVYVDGALNGTVVADESGNWSLTLNGTISAGQSVRVGNAIGNGINQRAFTIPALTTLAPLSLSAYAPFARVHTPIVGEYFAARITGDSGGILTLGGAGSAGLSISQNYIISGYPTATGPIDVIETLATSSNSPRTTSAIATTVASGGGIVPIPTVTIYGLISTSGNGTDGTVGQTDTGPDWQNPQWYRESLSSPKTQTLITGATSRTYTRANADIGFRPVMHGTDNGVRKAAAAWNPVFETPIQLQDFATTSGWTVAGSATLSLSGGKLVVTEGGAAGRAYKSIGTQTPSEWGVVTFIQDRGTDPTKNQSNGPTYGFATDTAFRNAIGGGIASGAADDGSLGINTSSRNVSEVSTLAAINTPTVLNMSTATSYTGSNFATVRKHIRALAKSGGRAKILPVFDDGFDTQFTKTAGQMEAVNIFGSFFLPWKIIDGTVSTSGRATIPMVQAAYAKGHAMCLDGTGDDAQMNVNSNGTTRSAPSDNVAELASGRTWLASNNLVNGPGGDGRDSICYPNGFYEDRTSGPYFKGLLPAALKAAGYKFARTTLAGTYATRSGFDDGWLLFPGCSMSGLTADQMKINVNLAILRGATVCLYFHQTVDAEFVPFIQWLAQQRDAGLCDVLTVPQMIAADYGSSFPN